MSLNEWVVYDPEQQQRRIFKAETQEQALKKGLQKGYIPQESTNVRPRTCCGEVLPKEKFQPLLQELIKK